MNMLVIMSWKIIKFQICVNKVEEEGEQIKGKGDFQESV